jgi:hypothetical protein
MDTQGTQVADWGFKAPADGWYLMEFMGDIKELSKEVDGDTKFSLQIPLKAISDLAGDEATFQMSIFIPLSGETDKEIGFAKKKMADVLVNSGLWEQLETKYPGKDVSVLDKRIVDAVAINLPSHQAMAKVETKESKKDKKSYTNIIGLAPRNYKPPADKGKKAPTTPVTSSTASNEKGWG